METSKRKYERPAMKVVELRQRAKLLQGSPGVTASRTGYGTAESEEWN